ncbi:MAG: alanine racemase [Alphaproteobacteria bacterium]|jgi:D-serine deaminase-like pyridoxal phosphate-dependent protein|nr:alanine racemase [Alphaproteobacteria bacterium]
MIFDNLPTPVLILDRGVLQRNLDAMRERMRDRGVMLRPHLKTAKSAKVATLALGDTDGAVTVSTLAEAEYFFAAGFTDIAYAVGIAPARLDRVAAIRTKGCALKILTDNAPAAEAVAEHAAGNSSTFDVLIEVDTGEGRAGLPPDSDDLLEIGRILDAAPGVALAGVLTHAGHSYACEGPEGIRDVAEEERAGIVAAAERLRAAGLPCPIVSTGSTPTATHVEDVSGVTEMRPGVYMFNDLKQLSIGSCARGDLALSVLASVIGQNRRHGHLLLDAGALALSKDISAHDADPAIGYGEVCDAETLEPLAGLHVAGVSQEHGVVPVDDPTMFDRLPIGARVRILPNHACITAAGYDRYHVLENGAVTEEWDRVNGW